MLDKIFKVGILLIGIGFLSTYIYHGRSASVGTTTPCNRYSLTTAGGERLFHTAYMLDTQDGTLYYAVATPNTIVEGKPLQWKIANPKTEAK
jgi:hypothetical protein